MQGSHHPAPVPLPHSAAWDIPCPRSFPCPSVCVHTRLRVLSFLFCLCCHTCEPVSALRRTGECVCLCTSPHGNPPVCVPGVHAAVCPCICCACLSVCLCVPLCVYVHLCLSLCLTVPLCACEHLCAMVCARVHLCTCAFPCLSAQLCPCIPAGRGGVFGCVCSVCCAPTASAPQSLLCPSSVLGMVGHTPSSASPGVSPWGAACTGTPRDPHVSGNPMGSCGVTGCHGEPGPGMRCCGAMQCWMHPDQGCGHAMGQQELIQQSGGVRVPQGTAEWGPPSTGGLSRGGSSHGSATVLSCS